MLHEVFTAADVEGSGMFAKKDYSCFYEINSEGQSLSPLVPTPLPKTKTIDNFSQKYKQSAQHQPPQHTTTLPNKNQSIKQQTNQNNQTLQNKNQPKSPTNNGLKDKFNLQEIPPFKPKADTMRLK